MNELGYNRRMKRSRSRPGWLTSIACAAFFILTTALARTSDALTPLGLARVKVAGEMGRRIAVTVTNNLLRLDVDKDFLEPFRTKAAGDGYIGLGKLIDAAVRFAAYTGDAQVLALKQHLVSETLRCQESDGYLGMLAPTNRMAGMWDIHEMGYLIYGLLADYRFFAETSSLAAARKAADYVLHHWSALPADWPRRTHIATHVAVTGIDRTFLTLYGLTSDARYLQFCTAQRRLLDWNQEIVMGRRDLIAGHVYGYLASCLAQVELYRLQPNLNLLASSQRAMNFLTQKDGVAITGGVGQWEIWTDDQDGRGELGETCATAYLLRLYDSLLRLGGDPRYGDLIERTMYNALFAAQSPDGRQLRYFVPFEGRREYHPTDTYCCPCNYRRIIAELPGMVYYRSGKGFAINLYARSHARIDLEHGPAVEVQQDTDYPNSGRISIHITPAQPASFPVQLRIPRWSKGARVQVNGQAVAGDAVPSGSFLVLERAWKAGDEVTLDLPMPWRLVQGRKRQAGRVAVMRGPLLFCLDPKQNPEIAALDAADLSRLLLLPASLQSPVPNGAVRPDGLGCPVRMSNQGWGMGESGNLGLTLTEFADPNGQNTYFRVPDLSVATEDELAAGGAR